MFNKLKNLRKKPMKLVLNKKSKAVRKDDKYNDLYETEVLTQQKRHKKSKPRNKMSSKNKRKYKYIDNDDESKGKIKKLPKQTRNEDSPSRIKKNSKYNDEYEYYTDNDNEYEEIIEDLDHQPHQRQYKTSPSRNKKNSRYGREHEYSNNDDDFEGEIKEIPSRKQYKISPPRVKKILKDNREYKDTNFDDEYEDEIKELLQQKQHEYSPSRFKRSSKYDREHMYTDYNDEYEGEIDDIPQPKQYKHSPTRTKRSSRYNRGYEYTDYDDKHGSNQYSNDYNKQMYDSGEEGYSVQYTTEDTSEYRGYPKRTREYYDWLETEYSDDSDLDSQTERRSDLTLEYPSEYQHEEIPILRHRSVHRERTRKRKTMPSETEVERSPYHQQIKQSDYRRPYQQEDEEDFEYRGSLYRDYESNYRKNPYRRVPQEVYVARTHDGHSAFKLKKQNELEEQTSRMVSEMDLDDNEELQEDTEESWRKNQSRYQVLAANTGDNQGVFKKQKRTNPREKLISVTDYDKSVPMIALKDTSANNAQDESQSIVYLPVVFMDDTIKLPNSKVVHAESLLRNIGDKAEKPLETNMNIYLATDNGQGNIFQQAQRYSLQEMTLPENKIQIYTSQSTHSIAVDKKPSVTSKKASKVKVKNKSKSDYPVQKSYINVMPSKTKPAEQKESKISIKSAGSKKFISSLLVGEDKLNSPKGSGYYSKIHKKEIKVKKEGKNKRQITSEGSDSELISVINPSSKDNPSNELRGNTILSTKGDVSTFDRHVPIIKNPTLDKTGVSESSLKKSQIITIKEAANGQYKESRNVFDQSLVDLQPQVEDTDSALKGLGSHLFNKRDGNTKNHSKDFAPENAPPNYDPYTFNPKEYNSPVSSLIPVQRKKSKESKGKFKKSRSGNKIQTKRLYVEFSKETEEFQFLSLNSHAFKYIYQTMQYFLGLSLHGTLMEILRETPNKVVELD